METPRVAIDARGDVAVVWADRINPYHTTIQLSLGSAGGSFSAPVTITEAAGENQEPDVALGPEGRVIVVWQSEADSEHAAREQVMFSAGSVVDGGFSAPRAISGYEGGNGFMHPRVAIAGDGEALAVWAGLEGEIHYASSLSGAQGFSAPRSVANPAGSTMFAPSIAISPSGSALAAWTDYRHVYATTREAGGSFGPAQTLETAPCVFDGLNAAINEAGDGVLSWTATNGECDSGVTPTYVKAAYRPADHQFESAVTAATMRAWSEAGGVAVSPAGEVTVSALGEMLEPASAGSATALTRLGDGSYNAAQALTRDTSVEEPPVLAYDSAGNLYAAADTRAYEEGSGSPASAILANLAPATGSFAQESALVQSVHGELDSMPVLAVAGSQKAAMAWTTGIVNEHFRAEVATLAGEAPPSAPASSPGASEPDAAAETNTEPLGPAQVTGGSNPTGSQATTRQPGAATPPMRPASADARSPTPIKLLLGFPTGHALSVTGYVQRGSDALVRLVRDGRSVRAVRARITDGRFHAVFGTAALSPGRYRLEVNVKRGAHTLRTDRTVELR